MVNHLSESNVNYSPYQKQEYYQHRNKTILVFIFEHYLYYAPSVKELK